MRFPGIAAKHYTTPQDMSFQPQLGLIHQTLHLARPQPGTSNYSPTAHNNASTDHNSHCQNVLGCTSAAQPTKTTHPKRESASSRIGQVRLLVHGHMRTPSLRRDMHVCRCAHRTAQLQGTETSCTVFSLLDPNGNESRADLPTSGLSSWSCRLPLGKDTVAGSARSGRVPCSHKEQWQSRTS